MIIIVVLLLVSVGAAFVYDRFLCPKSERWSWRHNLAATVVSIVLGVVTAIAIYQYQDGQQDEERRKRLCIQLSAELAANSADIRGPGLPLRLPESFGPPVVVQTLMVDEALRSGLFDAAETELLTKLSLAEHSYNARFYQYVAMQVVDKGIDVFTREVAADMEHQGKKVLALIDGVRKQLELADVSMNSKASNKR